MKTPIELSKKNHCQTLPNNGYNTWKIKFLYKINILMLLKSGKWLIIKCFIWIIFKNMIQLDIKSSLNYYISQYNIIIILFHGLSI
jgi:hypothetical protein